MYKDFQSYLQTTLKEIEEAGLYKNERVIVSPQRAAIKVNTGKDVLNFCANNYLGLSDNQELIDAAKKAYIYDQIMKLPNGFQSRAQQLSGGQQQRIAIARMFLKNPPIIFLDEPTASLDAIATEQIKASIDAIKKNRTVIIISHSISQIIDSDVIYALKEGRVEQSGDPDSLYRKGGIYKDIVDASARSLNIDKLAQTLDANGDGNLFD